MASWVTAAVVKPSRMQAWANRSGDLSCGHDFSTRWSAGASPRQIPKPRFRDVVHVSQVMTGRAGLLVKTIMVPGLGCHRYAPRPVPTRGITGRTS